MIEGLKKVLVIGSGPIIIGQAAEFDYAGTQACRALKEEGLEVVLINSNPATIMTDRDIADKVYIEPLTVDTVKKIIEMEKPDSILPTLGGQTGLLSWKMDGLTVVLTYENGEMIKAVTRLRQAFENKEKIVVFGDYDVDGTSGTALIQEVFHRLAGHYGFSSAVMLSDRFTEGYLRLTPATGFYRRRSTCGPTPVATMRRRIACRGYGRGRSPFRWQRRGAPDSDGNR